MGEVEEYNKEPIYYCSKCLSLKIKGIGKTNDFDYCDECGSTSIEKTNIEEWEKLYVQRHGHKYLEEF